MTSKEVVKEFYASDIAKDDSVMTFFHKDCTLKWNTSKGFRKLDYKGIEGVIKDIQKTYHSFRYRLSHLLEDENTVTARYTIYGTLIERPEKEDPIAHFISIWEVKDGKLFKGFEISQLADNSSDSLNSFAEIKV